MAQTKVKLVSNGVITVDNLHTNHGITTDHIGEGSVLYYTDARVQNYLTTNNYIKTTDVTNLETVTSLGLNANILSYTNEAGVTTNIDLSLYLDDTNLARLVSGTLNGTTGIATFTRDDASTFTVDFSAFLSDANDYVTSASFNTTNGVLTLTRLGGGTVTVDLDNRYLTSFTETDPIFSASAASGITSTNISNWNTAYGWGNHASAGYLTTVPAPLTSFSTSAWAGGGGYPGYIFVGGNSRFGFSSTTGVVDIYADGNFYATDSSHLVWHAGNDGSGSGLDADLLDGMQPGTGNNTIAYLGSTGNLVNMNPESYSGEIRLGAAWDRGGLYGSNHVTVATGSGKNIYFVIDNAVYGTLNTDYFNHTSDIRTPIFYDSNNTGYYVDPSSTSTSLNINGGISTPTMWVNYSTGNYNNYNENIRLFPAGNNVSVISYGASGTGGTPWCSTLGYADRFEIRQGTQWQQRNYNGYVQAYGSFRAPIFYDSNDTNSYFDGSGSGSLVIRGSSPTVYFRDTNQNSAMLHCNSHLLYVLRGNTDTTSWTQVGGQWPGYWNLTNNAYIGGGSASFVGDVTANTSDERLKENVKPIENALEKVKSINGVTFDWKDNLEEINYTRQKIHDVGVIAQEVQKVLPEIVVPAPFDTDEEGNSRSGDNYLTVQYEKIVPLLIEAIKEQQQQIEELKQLINK